MRHGFICILLLSVICESIIAAQKLPVRDFAGCIRSVDSLMRERSGVKGHLSLDAVIRRGNSLDFHFDISLSDYPLRSGDAQWLRSCLESHLPGQYASFSAGNLYSCNRPIGELIVDIPTSSGAAPDHKDRVTSRAFPVVRTGIRAPLGLEGRHIALWSSHGLYFNQKYNCWMWQRPCIFQTIEDIYTLSYILPLLEPMLENAGACVFNPRERDVRREEIIIDNDPCENTSARIHGIFSTSGKWKTVDIGFADTRAIYRDEDHPFSEGTSLKCSATARNRSDCPTATWSADIPERGEYALYVSYRSEANSCRAVGYTVHSLGKDIPVTVNQRMGGGTWIYLGRYEFPEGRHKILTLSALSSQSGSISADAVKVGGGMGCIERVSADTTLRGERTYTASRRPRFCECARYNVQWCGAPASVWNQNDGKDDYRDDIMCRGAWTRWLSGGSRVNPREKGLGIPIDLSFALHTDSGSKAVGEVVGTLGIYSLLCDNSSKLPSGESRRACREFTDILQTQLCSDISGKWDSLWRRRPLWNRSYSESRTTGVPAILLELLSHQNFEDMKFGADPQFRFDVARSCYKGILKYLSCRYDCPYCVQPLAPRCFKASLSKDFASVNLSWLPTEDPQEPTAHPSSYIVYTRIDDGGWGVGRSVKGTSLSVPVSRGHIYSFRVVAANEGGVSFPSETLSAGVPSDIGLSSTLNARKVIIVNNFTRISGPLWFDSSEFGGFDTRKDSGVADGYYAGYAGEQFEFRRREKFISSENPGFGASFGENAGKLTGGNSFDYPAVHGSSLMLLGCAFESYSAEAFCSAVPDDISGAFVIDLICGKQCRVRTAARTPLRYEIFPAEMQEVIRNAAERGCNTLVSGSYIASDIFSSIYPIEESDDSTAIKTRTFANDILGYTLLRSHGSKTGSVVAPGNRLPSITFPTQPCSGSYSVESPDALMPAGPGAETFLNYSDSSLPAAVRCLHETHRSIAFGFPLELILQDEGRNAVFKEILDFFTK